MRWRLVDRIDSFDPWKRICGTRAVSFEEASLMEMLGRTGGIPESMILGGLVELLRWHVAASSDFSKTCGMTEIDGLAFTGTASLGSQLRLEVSTEAMEGDLIEARCVANVGGAEVAKGQVAVALAPLNDSFDRDTVFGVWCELYGKA